MINITLMKKRIRKLKGGDLKSQITINGNDELADLSNSINKMLPFTRRDFIDNILDNNKLK